MPAIARSEPFRDQVCPLGVCDGSGWILGPEDVARACECRAERLNRGRSRGISSVIPRKFQGVSFDRPPISDMAHELSSREAVKAVQRFVDDLPKNLRMGHGLWLAGDTGTGKTSLAMLVSKEATAQGKTVAIYSLPKLLARIRRTYDSQPGGESYLSFFEQLTSVDLLQIDDVGAEKSSEWVLEQLYSIVNERYEAERSIVVTTNLDEYKLLEQIGERTVSRLLEICGEPKTLSGPDHRSKTEHRFDREKFEARASSPSTVPRHP
ncbi:MAG: replication protein DnaC [Solirubrobacterales bacterium]|jgi:DNA replication protein DnaC|nr:replication protein DnaC [Solirubrobacterales bacterium]